LPLLAGDHKTDGSKTQHTSKRKVRS
jgi:hypothetical protein